MTFAPILTAVLLTGVLTCSHGETGRANAKTAGETMPMNYVELPTHPAKAVIIKVADAKHRPRGDYLGKEEYEKALASGAKGQALFHLLAPAEMRETAYRHASGGKVAALAEPASIFRMPGSACHTFLILDPKAPGQLEAVRQGGPAEKVDLAGFAGPLSKLALHWMDGKEKAISYQNLPASLDARGGPP